MGLRTDQLTCNSKSKKVWNAITETFGENDEIDEYELAEFSQRFPKVLFTVTFTVDDKYGMEEMEPTDGCYYMKNGEAQTAKRTVVYSAFNPNLGFDRS